MHSIRTFVECKVKRFKGCGLYSKGNEYRDVQAGWECGRIGKGQLSSAIHKRLKKEGDIEAGGGKDTWGDPIPITKKFSTRELLLASVLKEALRIQKKLMKGKTDET